MSEEKENRAINHQQIESPQFRNMPTQTSKRNTLFEFDYTKFLWALLGNWMIIVFCVAVGCAAGFAYSHFFVNKQYQADASVFSGDTKSFSLGDISVGESLEADYIMVMKSRETLKAVINELNLNMNYLQLRNMIDIKADEEAHIITIKATANDPNVAVVLANTMVNVGKQRIFDVISGSEISVMELATTDSVIEVTPSMWKYIRYGALLGLLIPLAIIFLMILFDNTLSDEDEVTKKLKLPIVGSIPYFKDKDVLKDKMTFFEREAFNTLCGSIELSGYEIKTVAVTSSVPNEGKSTVSYKTAEILTQFGKKVCYVDADMRHSTFCQKFDLDGGKLRGLSEYLSKNIDISEALFTTNNPDLTVILPGKYPPNPSALLTTERFKNLLSKLKESFDYVIVDTPPVIPVIDGVFIAKECDGCMIVVEEGVTQTKQAIKTRNTLLAADVNVFGVVVNKVNRKGKVYGGYGRYGKYGKKYGKRYGYEYGYGYGIQSEQENKIDESV